MATETVIPGDEHIEHITRPPQSLWERILAEPDRAPEYIALVAAERFGPQAEEWVRIAGPGHTPEQLARVAYRKHVRIARREHDHEGSRPGLRRADEIWRKVWRFLSKCNNSP